MENMCWMLYAVLGSVRAKGGRWSAEMQREISLNASKISQVEKYLHPIESVPKGFLAKRVHRIYGEYVLDVISSTGVAGGKGWLVGCNGNVPQCGKIARGGNGLLTTESELEGFLANRVNRIHEEHVLDVISSIGVAGGKGGPVG